MIICFGFLRVSNLFFSLISNDNLWEFFYNRDLSRFFPSKFDVNDVRLLARKKARMTSTERRRGWGSEKCKIDASQKESSCKMAEKRPAKGYRKDICRKFAHGSSNLPDPSGAP